MPTVNSTPMTGTTFRGLATEGGLSQQEGRDLRTPGSTGNHKTRGSAVIQTAEERKKLKKDTQSWTKPAHFFKTAFTGIRDQAVLLVKELDGICQPVSSKLAGLFTAGLPLSRLASTTYVNSNHILSCGSRQPGPKVREKPSRLTTDLRRDLCQMAADSLFVQNLRKRPQTWQLSQHIYT